MSRVNIILALLVLCSISQVEGTTCKNGWGITYNCPGMLDSPEKNYCCPGIDDSQECCTEEEFVVSKGPKFVLPIILGVVNLVLIITYCICYGCCGCCPVFKNLERNVVYVREPVTYIEMSENPPAPAPANYGQNFYSAQVGSSAVREPVTFIEMSENPPAPAPANYGQNFYSAQVGTSGMSQPPSDYTFEVHSKRSPYNPSCPNY